ncbi:MAG: hypothetical protein PF517_14175 [Salinivirgaceae bacterium]|nr:hypothetical protein [Salinivirgaceae bacterium]
MNFYNQLKQRSNKNLLTRELYKQLIRKQKTNPGDEFISGSNAFEYFEGKTIASISIKRLDIFGQTTLDTNGFTEKRLELLVNKTHIHTRQKLIKNALLFNVGDKVSAITFNDNERLLRNIKPIHEAKIKVSLNTNDTNLVNVLVLTQDALPLQIGGRVYDVSSGRIDLNHNNIGGTDHQLINRAYFDRTAKKESGYSGTYRIPNIYKSFISTDIDYHSLYYENYYGIRFYRNFFTPDIKYAGAASIYFFDENPELLINDTLIRKRLDYRQTDIWIGRNFNLNRDYLVKDFRPGINISARYTGRVFNKRPNIYADSAAYYYDINRLLGKLGYSNQKFLESNMIYSSGKTEDIPIGYLIEFIVGMEFDDFKQRGYLGNKIAFATTLKRNFYCYNSFELGSYYNTNTLEQGVLRLYTKAFSPLIKTTGPMFRQFLSISYTQGFNMKSYQYVGLNNEYGIRSWNKSYPVGNYRFSLSSETVIFPKWYFYGVGSTFFTFADIGTVGNSPNLALSQTAYSSLGIGFRLRNDNFVFNSIEIRLSWFPVVPEGKNWSYYISSEQTLNLNDLKPGIPKIIPFE